MIDPEEKETKRLRVAALNMYDNIDGRIVIETLFEDLGFYDEPESEEEMVLHVFAMRIAERYLGFPIKTQLSTEPPDLKERSRLLEGMITATRPIGG